MNKPRRHASKRRLAVERIENRLMLSGEGFLSLDTDTFNLDPLSVDYAVISNDAVPQVTPTEVTPTEVTPPPSAPSQNADLDGTPTSLDSIIIRDQFIVYRDPLSPASTNIQSTLDRINQWRNNSLQTANTGVGSSLSDLSLTSDAWGISGGVTLHIFGNGASQDIKFISAGSSAGDVLDARANFDSVFGSATGADSLPVSGELPSTPVSQLVVPTLDERIDLAAPSGNVDVTVQIDRFPVTGTVPSLVIAPAAPANTIIPIGQSDAQVNVGQVIDELLTSGNDYIDQALPDDAGTRASDDIQLTGSGGALQTDSVLQVPVGNGKTEGQVASAGEVVDEGGMIPVQGIVDALAGESLAAPNAEHVVAAEVPVEITGELARVAVMELIDGETDPAAPQPAASHTLLVAADDATITPEQIVESVGREASTTFSAVRAIADQAGLATSLVAPVNPIYFAAIMSTAGDAFAAAAASAPLSAAAAELGPASDARHRAFSDWGDEDAAEARALAAEAPHRWLHAAPLVAVLACEQVLAAKRKRHQVAAQEPPASMGPRKLNRLPKSG